MLRSSLALAILWFASALPADTPAICDNAAIQAAHTALVPQNVMLAVTRLETGRSSGGQVRPWPWTANVAGDGRYFENRNALVRFLEETAQSGRRNFDAGCFQINYRWHGHEFSSISDMVDPVKNARYAATFLRKLYEETGDWTTAVGHYHSRTKKHADRYKRKYSELQASLRDSIPQPRHPAPSRRTSANAFALLLPGAAPQQAGSLVPLNGQGVRAFVE